MLLVVSHNIDFINAVATNIITIKNKQLSYYQGDYDCYKRIETETTKKYKNIYEKFIKSDKKTRCQIIDKLNKKDINNFDNNGALLTQFSRQKVIKFLFDFEKNINNSLIDMADISFGYRELLFEKVNLKIMNNTKYTLVGKNGIGKSTLLKLICGQIQPSSGEIKIHKNVVIGFYSQHFDFSNENITPVEYLQIKFNKLKIEQIRKHLGSFNLPSCTHLQKISNLSGGQKSRLSFAELSNNHIY